MEFGVALELWRVHVRDFLVWLVAFVITTFAGVEIGLLASIALSLLILILEVSFPHTALLGRLGKTNVYRWVWRLWVGLVWDLPKPAEMRCNTGSDGVPPTRSTAGAAGLE